MRPADTSAGDRQRVLRRLVSGCANPATVLTAHRWVGRNENGDEGLFPESYTSWAKPIAPGIAPISSSKVAKQAHPNAQGKDDMNATMTEIQDAINDINESERDGGQQNGENKLLAPIVETTNSKTSSQITVSTDENTDDEDDEDDEVNAKARTLLVQKNAQAQNGGQGVPAPTSLEFGDDSDEESTPVTQASPGNELLAPPKAAAAVVPESPIDAMMPRQSTQVKSGLKNSYTPESEDDRDQDKTPVPPSQPLNAHDGATVKAIQEVQRDSGSTQRDKHDSGSTQRDTKHTSHTSRASLPPVNTAFANTHHDAPPRTGSSRNSYDDVEQWNVDRVVQWAANRGFDASVREKLQEHEISGDVLLEMDANSLKEIDIVAFGKRVKIANAIKELRSQAGLEVLQPVRGGSETSSVRAGGYAASTASPVDLTEDAPSRPTSFAQRTGSGLLSNKGAALAQTPEEPESDHEQEHEQELPAPEKAPSQTDSPRTASATNSLRRAFSGNAGSPVMPSPRTSSARKRSSDTSAFFGVGSKGNPRKPAPRYSGTSNDTESPEEKTRKPLAARLLGSKRSIRNMNGAAGTTRSSVSPQPPQESGFVDTVSISDKRRSVVDITTFQDRDGTALQKIGGCDCKGWMKKRGERYGWKMRYFVLKGSQLFYLKNENDTQLKGFIQLNGFKVLNDDSNSSRTQFAFKIVHESERDVHYFASEEKSVARDWMNALMKASIVRDISGELGKRRYIL